MEPKVKYTEVVGELRKAARLFKVFEYAADAAGMMANLEKDEKAIKDRIEKYQKEAEILNSDLDVTVKQINQNRLDVSNIASETEAILEEARMEAKSIINEGKVKAEAIVSNAKSGLIEIKSQIEFIKKEKQLIDSQKEEAHIAFNSIQTKIQSTKDKFLKELG